MNTIKRIGIVLILVAAPLLAQSDWHTPLPGFKIAGNLYWVGTADLAVYLINTPQGNILINSDFTEDLPLIKKSIQQLGFKYTDTKIILISHAHDDHDEAVGTIRKETKGRLMVMDGDVPDVEDLGPNAHVDRVLHDGDTVELGGSKLTAHLTPGHTKGCTTWTMQVDEGGRKLNAVIIGSPNINAGTVLVGDKSYPRIAEDYMKTFSVLKGLPVDLFLGAHGSYFALKTKYPKIASGTNPFIDPAGYNAYVAEREMNFLKELRRQKQHPGSPAQ